MHLVPEDWHSVATGVRGFCFEVQLGKALEAVKGINLISALTASE
jgi:hypothetical protein